MNSAKRVQLLIAKALDADGQAIHSGLAKRGEAGDVHGAGFARA
jgi:hypothetical protein